MSIMTTTYPASSGVNDTPKHRWRFWSTFGWFVVACMAVMGAQYVVMRASAISASIPIHVDPLAWKYLNLIITTHRSPLAGHHRSRHSVPTGRGER